MQIEHINEEFPYTIVRELYTKEEENSKEKNIELQNKDYNDSVKEK